MLTDQNFERVQHARILSILKRNGSIDYAVDIALAHAETAREALKTIPDSEYKRALLWVPDFVVTRDK